MPVMPAMLILILAIALDAMLGDPKFIWQRIPHPVVLMGRAISTFDKWLNKGAVRKAKGIAVMAVLASASIGLGWAIETALPLMSFVGCMINVLLISILIGYHSLITHVREVAIALKRSLSEGRAAVGHIVGRKTRDLGRDGVARAAIESCAENFSDAAIAPIFWYCVGGLPALICYKMVNTADSMIGYKTADYQDFGWGAARLDDVLNWIPARLCAALMCLAHGSALAWSMVWREARIHDSPNAGWPETAMAGILGLRLAGPRVYQGRVVDAPYMNAQGRSDLSPDDILQAIDVVWRSYLWVVGGIGLWLIFVWAV